MICVKIDNEIYSIPNDIYDNIFSFYKLHRRVILQSKYNFIMAPFEFTLSKSDTLDTTDQIPTLKSNINCLNSSGEQDLDFSQFKSLCQGLNIESKELIKSILLISLQDDVVHKITVPHHLKFIITNQDKESFINSENRITLKRKIHSINLVTLSEILSSTELRRTTRSGDSSDINLSSLVSLLTNGSDNGEINKFLNIDNSAYVFVQTKQDIVFLKMYINTLISDFKNINIDIKRHLYGKDYKFSIMIPENDFSIGQWIHSNKFVIHNWTEDIMQQIRTITNDLDITFIETEINSITKEIHISLGDDFMTLDDQMKFDLLCNGLENIITNNK